MELLYAKIPQKASILWKITEWLLKILTRKIPQEGLCPLRKDECCSIIYLIGVQRQKNNEEMQLWLNL